MKNLVVLLLVTALLESFSYILMINQKPTFLYHHLYALLEYLLVFFMYRGLIKDKKLLIVPKFLLVITGLFWGLVFFKKEYFFVMIILGSLNIAILLFLYLRSLLLSDKILNYRRLLPFWVSVGFLVFYLPSIPFFSLLKYMKDRGLFFILNVLIILKSLFIIYGLICSNKEEK